MPAKHILCIDDDSTFLDIYRQVFEVKGYRVTVAHDPAEGFEAVKRERPDLITLDVMMPEKKGFHDGYALLKTLQSDPLYKDIPILMISALSDDSDVREAVKEGAASYLPKPEMTPSSLIREAEKLLNKK